MNDKIIENLTVILKLFQNKPQYLIKFLLENNVFKEEFLKKVFNSTELNRLRTFNESEEESSEEDLFSQIPHFKNINSMNEYFKNIIDEDTSENDIEQIYEKLNKDLEENLLSQLKVAIEKENYEEAAVLRDRMNDLNINFDD